MGAQIVGVGHAGGPQHPFLSLLTAIVSDVEVEADAGHPSDEEADDGSDDQVESPQWRHLMAVVAPGTMWPPAVSPWRFRCPHVQI